MPLQSCKAAKVERRGLAAGFCSVVVWGSGREQEEKRAKGFPFSNRNRSVTRESGSTQSTPLVISSITTPAQRAAPLTLNDTRRAQE